MRDEHQTTRAFGRFSASLTMGWGHDPAPMKPLGEGWVLVSSSMVATPDVPDQYLVLWFWRRRTSRRKPEPCKTCGAMARRGGRCLACGTEVVGG